LTDALAGTKTFGPAALRTLGGEAGDAAATAASLATQAAALVSRSTGTEVAAVDEGIDDVRQNFSELRPAGEAWDVRGGGVRRSLAELVPGGRVPSTRGAAFAKWREQLTPEEFDRVRAVPEYRDAIAARSRRPADLGLAFDESSETTIWLLKPSRPAS